MSKFKCHLRAFPAPKHLPGKCSFDARPCAFFQALSNLAGRVVTFRGLGSTDKVCCNQTGQSLCIYRAPMLLALMADPFEGTDLLAAPVSEAAQIMALDLRESYSRLRE